MQKKILVFCFVFALIMALMPGCSKQDDSSGGKTTSPTDISGTVKYAVYNSSMDDAKKIVEEFNKVYPNVKVELVGFDGGLTDFLTAQAATQSLPDVAYGWDNLTYFASQGWLYPLNEFIEKDEEAKYIYKVQLDGYTINDKIYAVPVWLQFSGMVLNLDLLDTLNMDVPDYNWTFDEFFNLAKQATTSEYSGINHVSSLDEALFGTFSNLHQMGYNPEKNQFDYTSGAWAKAIESQKALTQIAGLVSDNLKNSELTNKGEMDDYQKKFGKDADAFREGKVLIGFHGTWDFGWVRTLSWNWDFYPIPVLDKNNYRQLVHSDYAFMTSTAKYPEAAFALLKWISYGKDGILARTDYFANKVDAEGTASPEFFIPASTHPEVIEKFKSLSIVPNGVKYMFEHMSEKDAKQDYYKVLPDFWTILGPIVDNARQRVNNGESPSALASEVEDLINKQYKVAYDDLIAKIKQVQEEFDSSHNNS
ncbi:MAG TPA: extracellular solute-binding protein [Clostridiales bacterium]|nr:extracellular solute-binding protein [Clostridiales bacterium]